MGAVLGANVRYIIAQKLKENRVNSCLITLVINTFSSFLLGLSITILSQVRFLNFSSQLILFLSIGFLGSLSTFSTFIYDLFNLFIKSNSIRAFKLFTLSISLGIIAIALGSFLAG
tara:strand:- start:152 stop:499 length:348 start_codon:yes stop_codon:yes gene_type:complete